MIDKPVVDTADTAVKNASFNVRVRLAPLIGSHSKNVPTKTKSPNPPMSPRPRCDCPNLGARPRNDMILVRGRRGAHDPPSSGGRLGVSFTGPAFLANRFDRLFGAGDEKLITMHRGCLRVRVVDNVPSREQQNLYIVRKSSR